MGEFFYNTNRIIFVATLLHLVLFFNFVPRVDCSSPCQMHGIEVFIVILLDMKSFSFIIYFSYAVAIFVEWN